MGPEVVLQSRTSGSGGALGARVINVCVAGLLLAAPGCADEAVLVLPTVTEDASLPSFTLADGTRLHLETYGDPANPVLVLLHGGPGADSKSMHPLTELDDRYFVVAYDQRGAGLSQRVKRTSLSGPKMLADLEEVVDAFSPLEPVTLIGHSWGGQFAAYFIQEHPERVSQAVLIEAGALNWDDFTETFEPTRVSQSWIHHTAFAETALSPDDHARLDYLHMVGLAEGGLGDEQFRDPHDAANFAIWRFGFASNQGMLQWWNDSRADFSLGLEAFEPEVLLVAGDYPGRTGRGLWSGHQAEAIAPYFANARVVEIPDADHGLVYRRPEPVLAAIRDYLVADGSRSR